MIKIYKYGEVSNDEIFARDNIASGVEGIVTGIIADVIENGDKALYAYAKKFDKADLDSLEVTPAEIDEAVAAVDPAFLDILREAAVNIRAFHSRQARSGFEIQGEDGIVLNLPGMIAGLPEEAYTAVFVPVVTEEEAADEEIVIDGFGMAEGGEAEGGDF